MMPKVDTFEHDIVDEIKRKDASLTEISAASNNVGNEADLPKKPPIFLIVLIACFTVFLLSLIGVMYYYYHDMLLPPSAKEVTISPSDVPKVTTDTTTLSPTLGNAIGRFVTRVEKKDRGYVLTITDYSSVFAYMTRNEGDYILELALLFSQPEAALIPSQPTSTTPVIATSTTTSVQVTSTTTTATSTGTSTKQTSNKKTVPQKVASKTPTKTATSTKTTESTSTQTLIAATPTEAFITPSVIVGPHFSDVTLENQNMRVWTSGKRSLVYAFVGNTTVLISDTPEGILALKSAILH